MQKVIIRLGLYLGGLGLALFIGVFIWANWTPLSPGEKAEPVNFALFDVSKIKNEEKLKELNKYIDDLDGVNAVLYSPPLKSIVVTYKVLEISDITIMSAAKEHMNFDLKYKEIKDQGQKKCPMMGTLTFMSHLRRTLNCRG